MLKSCNECGIPLSRRESADGQCPICGTELPEFALPEDRPPLPALSGSRDDPFDELWFRRDAAATVETVVPPPHSAQTPASRPSRPAAARQTAQGTGQPWRISSTDDQPETVTTARPDVSSEQNQLARHTPAVEQALQADPQPRESYRYLMRIELEDARETHEIELSSRELSDLPRLADRLLPGSYSVFLQLAGENDSRTLLQFDIGGETSERNCELFVRDSLGQLRQLSESDRELLWKRWHEQLATRAGIGLPADETATWVVPTPAVPAPAAAQEPVEQPREPQPLPPGGVMPGVSEVITDLWADAGRGEDRSKHLLPAERLFSSPPEGERRRRDGGMAELGRGQLRAGRSAQTRLKLRRIRTGMVNDPGSIRE
ncbi:MAG: hypothetical protein KDA79_02580 [Planctomycetaceae bacterium]|nr:hypothetical protein [Planctomycetaceae bacterium]